MSEGTRQDYWMDRARRAEAERDALREFVEEMAFDFVREVAWLDGMIDKARALVRGKEAT